MEGPLAKCNGLARAMRVSGFIYLFWFITYYIIDNYNNYIFYNEFRLVLGVLIGILYGLYAKTILGGIAVSTLFLSSPYSLATVPPYSGISILLTLLFIVLISYKNKLWDSSIEPLFNPSKYYFTPILLAVTLGSIYYYINFKLIYNPFYIIGLAIAAIIASKSSETLPKAITFGSLSSLGHLGLVAITAYSSYKPLPPLRCNGLQIDKSKLIGYEEETSPTRAILPGEQWKDRTIACTDPSTPILSVGRRSIIWVYSRDPKGLIINLARKLRLRRPLLLDLDSVGPCESPVRGSKITCLGDLSEVEITAHISSLYDKVEEYDAILVYSCRMKPRDLARSVAILSSKTLVIVSICLPEEDSLIVAAGPEGGGVILTIIGDPLLFRTILEKLFGFKASRLMTVLNSDKVGLVYPYCNDRWGLVLF